MRAIAVEFDRERDRIEEIEGAVDESWETVCERFENDVHRIRDAGELRGYNALYECFDADDRPSHYLVEESRDLYRTRHRTFLRKLGRGSTP